MQFFLNGLVTAAIVSVAAAGFHLIYRVYGFFNFAYGAAVPVGGYALLVFVEAGVPFPLAMSASIIFGAMTGALMEIAVFKPMRNLAAGSLPLLLASLGLYTIVVNCIALHYGNDAHAIRNTASALFIDISGASMTTIESLVVIISVFVVSFSIWLYSTSYFGIFIRAVSCDSNYAEVAGVKVEIVRLVAVIYGCGLGGLAGALKGIDANVNPIMGLEILMMAIVAAVIGGESLWRTIGGGLGIGLAQHVGVIWLPTHWQSSIVFAILIIYLLVFPRKHQTQNT
jgi:branched-subunit amino acid ABC-type transport system permease component